jgi:hypothetical protein
MGFSEGQGATGLRGMMLLNPRHRSTFDVFKVTQNGCQLRIYPELNAVGDPLPIRTGRQLSDVGEWVNGNHFAIQFLGGGIPGKERISLLLSIKGDDKIADPYQRRGLQVWDRLRNTLYHHVDNGTAPRHWVPWVTSRDWKTKVFGDQYHSKAKGLAFFRGLLTWYKTERGAMRNVSPQQPRMLCVFFCGTMAQNALIELVMKEVAGAENVNTDDWNKVFEYNDRLVDMTTGCLITFGKPGGSTPQAGAPTAPQEVKFGGATGGTSVDDDQFRVEAKLMDKPCAVPLEWIQRGWGWDGQKALGWNELLNVHEDEKALVAALEVGFADDLIIEAFRDSPEYLSPQLLARKRRLDEAAAHPPAGTPAGTPAQPGGVYSSPPPSSPPQESPALAPGDSPPDGTNVHFGGGTEVGGGTAPWEDEGKNVDPPPQQAAPAQQAQPSPISIPDANAPAGQPNGADTEGLNDMMEALDEATAKAEGSPPNASAGA